MKRIIFILVSLISLSANAQKLPGYGYEKVRIVDTDKTIRAEIFPVTNTSVVKTNLLYFWYSTNAIHSTQGGFSGKLLNGGYTEYYLNKNLKAQGQFKSGLKNGVWKDWDNKGNLIHAITWKNGVMITEPQASFWKKLNIFKRKKNPPPADSLKSGK